MHFQQGFVNTAEFLRAKIAIINGTQNIAIHGKGQGAKSLEQVGIGNVLAVQVSRGLSGEQIAPQCWKAQLRATAVELVEHQAQAAPEIGVARAASPGKIE